MAVLRVAGRPASPARGPPTAHVIRTEDAVPDRVGGSDPFH